MPGYSDPEKPRRLRAKIPCRVHVRPSSPMDNAFGEALSTKHSSPSGCYFATRDLRYKRWMRLFVAFSYSAELGAIHRGYVAQVLRVEDFPDFREGIAVRFVTKTTLSDQKSLAIIQINTA
jgi:hypothetical protein